MKRILTILFAATIAVSAFGEVLTGYLPADTSKYILTIKQGKYEKVGNQTYLLVPTTLTNNTNDTLRYLGMSCSWREFYYIDNDKMSVQQTICTRNIPIMLTLLPHKSVDRVIKLIIEQTKDTSKLKFKIGLNLLKLKDEDEIDVFYDEFIKGKLTKNIIWSNTITQTDTIIVENIIQFYKYNDKNYSNVDAINFILKVTNRSENPIPDLGVTNRSKYVNLYINGQIDNPLSLYNGDESVDGVKTIAIDSTQIFDSGGWIISADSGLLKKFRNEFTVQWEYMKIKSKIIRVNVDKKTFIILN